MRPLPTMVRNPKWVVVSAYVGRKKSLRGLTYATRFTFYRKKIAETMAGNLNRIACAINFGPGKDFEFIVVPYSPDEV